MRSTGKGLAEIHLAVLLFGLAGLFAKMLSWPSAMIVFGRVFVASVALTAMLMSSKSSFRLNARKDYFILGLLGALLAVHWTTFFKSIQVSTVAIGLLSFSSFPVFVALLEPYFFKEKITLQDWGLTLLTFTGLALVVPNFDLAQNTTQGVLWGVASGLTFAILSILNRKYVKNYSAFLIAWYQDVFAAIVLLPVLFLYHFHIAGRELLLIVLLGTIFTALSHSLFIKGMTHVKAQTASIIASLEPVYGIIAAVILLREIPTLRTIAGGIIILAATFLATLRSKQTGLAVS